MSDLSAEERQKFIAAASAVLGKQEKMELIEVQLKEELGGKPGRVSAPHEKVEDVMVPARILIDLLIELRKSHPDIPAFRFRGRIITLSAVQRNWGVSIIKESDIKVVEE